MFRKSFAAINVKTHFDAEKRDFNFNISELNGSENEVLANQILKEFSDNLSNAYSGTGEWQWLQENKQNIFIDALMQNNLKTVSSFLTNMFKNECTYGYLSPSFSDTLENKSKVASDILCNIDTCIEFSDLTSEEQLTTVHGNPYGLCCSRGTILPDTTRHFYYSYIIYKLLKPEITPLILEIGGGYGGLCLQTWKRFDGNCTLVNIDLLPALIATYFFLSKNGIPVQVVKNTKQIRKNSVNLICAGDVSLLDPLKEKTDFIFNSRSLCEMSEDTIFSYFEFINNCDAKYFYHENSNFLLFPESERHIEVLADDFPVDESKYVLQSKSLTPFTGGDGRYREYIYKNRLYQPTLLSTHAPIS